MAVNWTSVLNTVNSGLQMGNNLLNNPTVRNVGGLGLIGAGLAQNETPGYATDAIQFMRNQLTSPTAIGQQVGQNVSSLQAGFQPLLDQQANEALNNAQQRMIAGQPSSFSTAMSGPEIGAIRSSISRDILPRQQALMNELAMSVLNTQGQSARSLLEYAKPDPMGGLLAGLGTELLRGQGGLLGTGQQQGQGGGLQDLLGMFGQNSSVGDALNQAVSLANTTGNASQLSALLSSGVLRGTPFPMGIQASTPAGQAIQQAINAGLVESPAATAAGGAGAGGGILASSLGTVLGALGSGVGGYFAGQAIGGALGQRTDSQGVGALGGAASGAAAGAAIGSIVPGIGTAIGAIVGGIAGLFGGFGETSDAQHALKAQYRREDLDAQADYVQEIGSFFVEELNKIGIPPTTQVSPEALAILEQRFRQGWDAPANISSLQGKTLGQAVQELVRQTPGPGNEQEQASTLFGAVMLAEVRRMNPAITSLQQVPGLKDAFVDYLTRSTFSATNSASGGGPPVETFSRMSQMAGLLN